MSKWIVYTVISITAGIVMLPWVLMVVAPAVLIIFDFIVLPILLIKLLRYTRMKNNIIRILMVDDTPETLMVLQKVLAEKDYQLTIVDSGKRAIEQLKNNKFDLLVLDEFMQELSGLETLKRADEIINNGQNNIKNKLPVIMYSSCTDEARSIVDFTNFKIIAKLSKQASSSHLRPFVNNIIEDIQGDAA